MQPDQWKPISAPVRKLQALVRRIGALNGMLRMECNRRENTDIDTQDSVERMINHLKMEIEAVRREIKDHISNDAELKRQDDLLQSIPGIGAISSSMILSFMTSKEFKKAKEVTAFSGGHQFSPILSQAASASLKSCPLSSIWYSCEVLPTSS